ncbi:MAG: hypothetical protein EBQ96_01760 [Proteobacteria bacterium]|nr:hypothetical protein [Pseudomonadota bacterium]
MTEKLTSSGALSDLPLQVEYTTLLKFMGFAPLSLCLVALDQLFLDGAFRHAMHLDAETMINLMAILTFPHIIASLVSFIDPEYARYYKQPLLKGLGVSLAIPLISITLMGVGGVMMAVAFYSLYHNIMQQFGIASMMMAKKPDTTYNTMKWLLVLPSCLGYAAIAFPFFPGMAEHRELYMDLVGGMLGVACILALRYYIKIHNDPSIPTIGKQYFASNAVWMLVSYVLIITGYDNFAVLVSRVVHDFTAYWIYMVHDQNRNTPVLRNPFYKLPTMLGLKPRQVLLPFSIAISAGLLMLEGTGYIMAIIIAAFNVMHYYIEGHTWKRGTLHRRYVPFT